MATTTACPIDCFLTRGRQALIAALKADVCLNSLVKRWFTFAEGLLERVDLRPADCPQIQVYPAEGAVDVPINVYDHFTYDINVGMATDWQNVAPCFRILCAVLRVVRTAGRSRLGLTGDCLLSVVPLRFQFKPYQSDTDPRIRWQCILAVRFSWNRMLP